MSSFLASGPGGVDFYAPDGPYAFRRMALSLVISTIVCAGMWAVIVVLPPVQAEFGVDRAAASLPYTVVMFGVGFVLAGFAPTLAVFAAAHALIGVGAGTGFGPMMADVSHWFVRRRGLAVVFVASGSYLAGAIWPLAMNATMPAIGWRGTYAAIAIFVVATMIPLSFLMRRRPAAEVMAQAG